MPARRSRTPYRVYCQDSTGEVVLAFFNMKPHYMERLLPVGQERLVSGRAEWFHGVLQMVNPEHIMPLSKKAEILKLEMVYPLTYGLTLRNLSKTIQQAVQTHMPHMPEWLDEGLLAEKSWPSWHEALRCLHAPDELADIMPESAYRQRLAYDELLAYQLALAISRRNQEKEQGIAIHSPQHYVRTLLGSLPFTLTDDQEKVWQDIQADMESEARMVRLLQGDVGCGKTIVGLLAMLHAVESGAQAAFMAPTEILAWQQYLWTQEVLEQAGLAEDISLCFLSSGQKSAARKEAIAAIETGKVQLVFGTHALFQEQVVFENLACVVIDEQHRFGVEQRARLTQKGQAA